MTAMPISPLSYPAIFGTFAVTVVISVIVQLGPRPLGLFPIAFCLELAYVYPMSQDFIRLKAAMGSVPTRLRLINIPAALGFAFFLLIGLKVAVGFPGILAGCVGAMATAASKLMYAAEFSSRSKVS